MKLFRLQCCLFITPFRFNFLCHSNFNIAFNQNRETIETGKFLFEKQRYLSTMQPIETVDHAEGSVFYLLGKIGSPAQVSSFHSGISRKFAQVTTLPSWLTYHNCRLYQMTSALEDKSTLRREQLVFRSRLQAFRELPTNQPFTLVALVLRVNHHTFQHKLHSSHTRPPSLPGAH